MKSGEHDRSTGLTVSPSRGGGPQASLFPALTRGRLRAHMRRGLEVSFEYIILFVMMSSLNCSDAPPRRHRPHAIRRGPRIPPQLPHAPLCQHLHRHPSRRRPNHPQRRQRAHATGLVWGRVRCVYSERAVTVPSHRLLTTVVLTFTYHNCCGGRSSELSKKSTSSREVHNISKIL